MTIRRKGSACLSVSLGVVLIASVAGAPVASATARTERAVCAATTPAGSGTLDDPYLIASTSDLEYLHQTPDVWASHFRQSADVDLAACTWTKGIGSGSRPFSGTYDGAGFGIWNLERDSGSSPLPTGFFDVVTGSDASLRSIHLIDATIKGRMVGGLVGMATGRAEIKASSVTGSVVGSSIAGGLVGSFRSSGVIINAFSTADVSLPASGTDEGSAFGGLVGVAGNNARIFNSYAIGSVADDAVNLGPLVGQNLGTVTNAVWNPDDSGVEGNGAGLQRTNEQMREWVTYRSLGWHIFDGFSRSQPWSICSGVNDGYPFLSQRYLVDPCPTLSPSTSAIVARRGVAIDPVSFTANGFTPTSYEITSGKLPKGLTLNSATGRITGVPTKRTAKRVVKVTGSDGRTRVAAPVSFTIEPPQGSLRVAGCEVSADGLTLTCTKPGTYTFEPPDGFRLDRATLVAADGGQYAPLGIAQGPFGLGARVQVAGSAGAPKGEYEVTVGETARATGHGDGAWWEADVNGGGYSAVQVLGEDGKPAALIGAAGGGGGGWEANPARVINCILALMYQKWTPSASWPVECGPKLVMSDTETQLLVEAMSDGVWGVNAMISTQSAGALAVLLERLAPGVSDVYVGSAGLPGDIRRPLPTWSQDASGRAGSASISKQQTLSGRAGRPGITYVPEGAEVATRPLAFSPRDGWVQLTFVPDDTPGGATTSCDAASPALGQIVTCTSPGRAFVAVPDGAEVAMVTVAGAGGGGGRTTIATGIPGTPLTGGTGAAIQATVDVRDVGSVSATVGQPGAAAWYTPQWTDFTWYGSGGGASGLGSSTGAAWLSAGGGGGANGFDAYYSQVPKAYRAGVEAWVATSVAGGSQSRPAGAVELSAGGASTGQGVNAGAQGSSWQAGSLLKDVTVTANGRSGGAVNFGADGLPAENPAAQSGKVTMKFCSTPEPPTLTVTPGKTPGSATADIVAIAGSDGGCATDAYEFRVYGSDAWVSAPSLTFDLKYLESAQTLCVQMRAHNQVGYGPDGAFACGVASEVNADAQAGGEVNTPTITVSGADGVATPTTIFVNPGETFNIANYGRASREAYVRPSAAGGATFTDGAVTCEGNGQEVKANCFLKAATADASLPPVITPGVTTYTVVSRGAIVIYSGTSNHMMATTISIS